MPAKTPTTTDAGTARLLALGQQIRAHRKGLRVSATTVAQAAGLSRVTLHRIESGEASVTIGAYMSVMATLGLELGIVPPAAVEAVGPALTGWIPARIRLADYPQLKSLAWQTHGTDTLTPPEALGIYERNWRHLDTQALEPKERSLVDALRLALGDGTGHV